MVEVQREPAAAPAAALLPLPPPSRLLPQGKCCKNQTQTGILLSVAKPKLTQIFTRKWGHPTIWDCSAMWMWSTWYLLLGQLPLSWRTRKTNWPAVEFGPIALAAAGLSASPRAAGRSNSFCKFSLPHEKTEGQLSMDEATCWVAVASAYLLLQNLVLLLQWLLLR